MIQHFVVADSDSELGLKTLNFEYDVFYDEKV